METRTIVRRLPPLVAEAVTLALRVAREEFGDDYDDDFVESVAIEMLYEYGLGVLTDPDIIATAEHAANALWHYYSVTEEPKWYPEYDWPFVIEELVREAALVKEGVAS